jgi:arylsulfatase A-like enzyme
MRWRPSHIAWLLIVAVGGSAATWWLLRGPRDGGAARHVILISLDTTRADFLGCYGNEQVKTPSLDRVASESIQFTDYMTAAPSTLASHASLFTGKYPHTHGAARNGFVVSEENATLAEVLKEAGFHTAAFIGAFPLDSRFQLAQGFDHYDQAFSLLAETHGGGHDERRAEEVTEAAMRYLEDTGIPERLFLFVHYFDPHLPYDPPSPYDRMYDPDGPLGAVDVDAVRRECLASPGGASPTARRLSLQYAGEVSYMDHHIGRLLDFLRRKGVLDQALLIVTSDHGEGLCEPTEPFDHGTTTVQSTVRSVGMIRSPGSATAGTKLTGTASAIDVLPTVLEALNLPIPSGVEGEAIDLARPDAARVRFCEATRPNDRSVEVPGEWTNARKERCVRDGRWKFIQTPWLSTERFFDLDADPLETTNLLDSPTEESQAAAGELRRKLEAWAASARPLPSQFDTSQREETERRLRSLGYVN